MPSMTLRSNQAQQRARAPACRARTRPGRSRRRSTCCRPAGTSTPPASSRERVRRQRAASGTSSSASRMPATATPTDSAISGVLDRIEVDARRACAAPCATDRPCRAPARSQCSNAVRPRSERQRRDAARRPVEQTGNRRQRRQDDERHGHRRAATRAGAPARGGRRGDSPWKVMKTCAEHVERGQPRAARRRRPTAPDAVAARRTPSRGSRPSRRSRENGGMPAIASVEIRNVP